ncbi:Hypothetical predicted protein [Octopus vulgaris]|uniref:Zinc finger MYM-type protein 1-like n=1 Tax=Octopus vulgaris TaxID=6645 RepID=A0AA36FLA0_OCTVU|nr:Hypothetical predicted protein [Octopus vulgaris]
MAMLKLERSQRHIKCLIDLKIFGNVRIDLQLDARKNQSIQQHNEKVRRNRSILQRLIDVVIFLGLQELSFRGHFESEGSNNRGNYKELVYLISKYDKQMESHLDTASIFTGLSNRIQNDLIEAIHKVMLNEMQKEIDQAKFVSILVDETSDVSASSQLSTVLRYVTEDCVTKERFIGFSDVSADRSANALSEHVFKCIETWECGNKLIAQTYDGAATMAGQLNGLQAKSKSHDIVYCKQQIDKTRTVLENKLDNFSVFYDSASIPFFLYRIVLYLLQAFILRLRVKYEDHHNQTLCLNPAALEKVTQWSVKDRVKILSDVERVKTYQEYRGEWNPDMKSVLGKTGIIYCIFPDGDLVVSVSGKTFVFNPLCCEKVSGIMLPEEGDIEKLVPSLRMNASVTDLLRFSQEHTEGFEIQGQKYGVGGKVKIIDDIQKVKKYQDGHGGWIDFMKTILGKTVVVKMVLPNADLLVWMPGVMLQLNPKCCENVSDSEGGR